MWAEYTGQWTGHSLTPPPCVCVCLCVGVCVRVCVYTYIYVIHQNVGGVYWAVDWSLTDPTP